MLRSLIIQALAATLPLSLPLVLPLAAYYDWKGMKSDELC